MGYQTVYERSMRDPTAFWAEAAEEIDWDRPWDRCWTLPSALLPLVQRRHAQYLLQRRRPPCRAPGAAISRRSSMTARSPDSKAVITYAELREQVARFAGALRGARRREGRPGHHLHADGARGDGGHARPARGSAPCIRWSSAASRRTSSPPASTTRNPGHGLRLLRHRTQPRRAVQADAGRGHRAWRAQAGALHHPPAPAGDGRAGPGPRHRLERRGGRRRPGRLRAGRRHRSALHPLHLRHHRPAQGRGARQWRPRGGAGVDDEELLQRRARRGVLGGLRCRLGGRPLLHRLRATAARLHHDPLRGQARRHSRRRRLLAGHRSSTRSRRSSPRRPRSARSSARIPTREH